MNQNNDYELFLFYYAYQTFTKTADDIIAEYGLSRQHHRFLFFINKLPGITTKQLLMNLEISKQGSHATLKRLKAKGYIYEKADLTDRRLKCLYPTQEGSALIQKLNQAQSELFNHIKSIKGDNWYAMMEGFAAYRQGYKDIKHLKLQIDEGEES
ncbi:MarR family transcriptional regulator [Staphylococcus felis]|uniref:MarR family transcriptional regulator n=1 Tax=Staphylococcus felis TaxID=46127 RepID=A0A2K3ZIE1_9STAP|nr:MarR family transcriptional regulator [Staphylococcus felis]AVP36363.1 MarR family transcriptional regulator [Staphylococcus felis]MBH9581018.1 MarR family transcriptional regulator [Staphylococcus felis]MDM8328473.1 MarR family transcriptional regulator [Staphylococcus felis]MDQ7193652.1 MarR family transcriptional regulator [Staphylococcus felis]PNZ37601.1 MarR family transcriptional regulator [Staphylococcus felis]